MDGVARRLDAGAPIEQRGMWENTPLIVACHNGHAGVASLLLSRGADVFAVHEKGAKALLYCCVEGLAVVADAIFAAPGGRERSHVDPWPSPVYS